MIIQPLQQILQIQRIILNVIVLILFIAFAANAEVRYIAADSNVISDSLDKKSGKLRTSESEVVITFEASNLAPQNVRTVFNDLFRQYAAIKDALVYNDPYNAQRNTLKLLDDMKSKTKDIDIMNKDDRWVFFLSNFDNIKRKVESAGFISEQRFLFNEITNGIKNFIKQFGLYNKTIYLMKSTDDSQSGNAEWFSDSKDKKNPYLGLIYDTTYVKVKEIWKF